MRNCTIFLAGALVLAAQVAQAATTYTWNLTGGENPAATTTSLATNSKTFTSTTGSKTLTVRALYSTNDGSSGALRIRESITSPDNDYARLQAYGGGLGIVNPVNSDEVNEPNHAVDNNGRDEFLLFDFEEAMNLDSFRIGYSNANSSSADSRPDIDIWVGPNNASPVSFFNSNGTSSGVTIASLVSAGFTKYNTFQNVATNTTVNADPNNPNNPTNPSLYGRYMLVSGALGSGNNDAFKFNQITGTATPEPGTIVLLGIGLVGFVWAGRRQRAGITAAA
jgi:hypothetical protein